MRGYKTSRDYHRLKELLDNGYMVIVICFGENIGFGSKKPNGDYYFGGGIGMTYLVESSFVKNCILDQVEFIEPMEE